MKRKKAVNLYTLAAICFYLAAVFQFFGGMAGSGAVYLSVGTVFLALGAGEGRKKGPPSSEKDEKEGETPKDEKQNLGE